LHRFCLIHPCDGRTDRRTDGRTELRWLRRAIAVPAVARNKMNRSTEFLRAAAVPAGTAESAY